MRKIDPIAVIVYVVFWLWGVAFGIYVSPSEAPNVSTSETFKLVPSRPIDLCELLKAPCLNGVPILQRPKPKGYQEI